MKFLGSVLAIASVLLALWFGFNFVLWGRITGPPTTKNFEAIAKQGQPLAQAISDYRSDHGLLPENWNDLVPAYLPQRPKDWLYGGEYLSHHSGMPHTYVGYRFDGIPNGWHLNGDYGNNQAINVPGPTEKKSSVSDATLFARRLAEFEKRITTNPQDFDPYRDKIDFAIFSQSNNVALAECERAAKILPNWWLPPMALAVLRTNDSKAEENFISWVQAHPTFINYWYLSRFYRDKDNYEAAFAVLEKATGSPFSSNADQAAEIQDELRSFVQGNPSTPAKVVTQTPDDASWSSDTFARDAARFCGENRNYDLALKIIQHCRLGDLALQASAELCLGQFEAATNDAQQAAVADQPPAAWAQTLPQFLHAAQAHNTNFWSYAADDDDSDWVLFFEPPEVSSVSRYTAQNELHQAYQNEQKGDLAAAIASCTKVIQLSPRSAEAYNLRSWSEFLKNDFDLSIADANRAIQLNLNFGNAYGTRGWDQYAKGDSPAALDDLKTAIQICGAGSLEGIEDQGMIEFINGNHQNAINSWQKAIQLNPSSARHLQPWIEKATHPANR